MNRRRLDSIADAIATFSGSNMFLLLNAVTFLGWIFFNVLSPWSFDKYPFSFLTLAVSLEAIFLSLFILASENRQSAHDREMAQHDLEVDMRAEQMIAAIEQKVDRIEALVLQLKGESQ